MKKFLLYFLTSYYVFGAICLPRGDFSYLKELPQMYRHCKATEDKDMTMFDFLTDHLIDFDCIFDQHENNDEQKPHSPLVEHHQQPINYFYPNFSMYVSSDTEVKVKGSFKYPVIFYSSDFKNAVFRPPIA